MAESEQFEDVIICVSVRLDEKTETFPIEVRIGAPLSEPNANQFAHAIKEKLKDATSHFEALKALEETTAWLKKTVEEIPLAWEYKRIKVLIADNEKLLADSKS